MWLLIITLVPSMTVLGIASWAGNEAATLLGASGSWSAVAESGRALIDAAERAAGDDAEVREAARAHRDNLSSSLTQANRWQFIGGRMQALLPLFFLALFAGAAIIAIFAARRMSRSVSRPIRELVEWSGRLAREEPLPEPSRREAGEVKELQALRGALRHAAGEIRTARARALEAERTRSWGEMARRVAHEMKNPLTPLRLASHRLNAVARERADLAEPIAVIGEETERLEELAARFARLGRPADGPRAAVDVTDLMQRLLATDVPADFNASLHAPAGPAYVLGDYNALIQVFRNIVRNAVEATRPGEPGALDVMLRHDGEWLEIELADRGRGFGAVSPDEVFEPDFTSKQHGTGLGLAIARQTIRAHGGEIAAHARPDGATFVVRLPVISEEDQP